MKLSLEGFHKVSKDGDKTTLRHPSGHEMTINHSILSPKMRGEIEALPQAENSKHPDKEPKKLASGGDVEDPDVKEVEDSYNKFAGTMKPQPKPLTREEKYKEIRKRNTSNASGDTSPMGQPVYADGGGVTKEDLTIKDPDSGQVEKFKEKISPGPTVRGDDLEASIPDEELAAQQAADALPEEQIQQATNEVPGVNPEVQASPYDHAKAAAEAHSNMTAAHNAYMQALAPKSQPQAAPQSSPAEQPQASQQAPQQEVPAQQPQQAQPVGTGTVGQAESATQEMQSYIKDQDKKNTDVFNKVMQNKIDPNRLWNNKDTGTKIVNTIGLILGGLGASSETGGKNLAVEAMNHAIERDVDAQKSNQTNQMNLYKMNLEATHNAEEARNMTVNQLLAASGAELAKKSAGLANELTKQKILEAGQDIQQKMIANAQNSFLLKQLQGSDGGVHGSGTEEAFNNKMNTLRMLKPDFAKDLEAKYLPGIGVASVPVPEKQRDKIVASKALSRKLAELENFSREHSGTIFDPAVKAKGHALANDVISSYRIATDQGVFKPSDQAFLEKSLPMDPTAFFAKYRTIPAYKEVRRLTDESVDQIQKSYGVKPFGQSQQQAAIPEGTQAKTKSGQPVVRKNGQWVKQ